jgi:Ca2+-binding RTX toxin-like protein
VLVYNGTDGNSGTITSTVRLSNVDAAALVARGFDGVSQGPVFTLGSDGADTYAGTPNADRYDGAGGNDDINGAGGDDILRGGAGDDILRPGQGADSVDGGAGFDTVSYAGQATALTIDLRLTSSQVNDGTQTDTLTTFEKVIGSDAADVIQGSDTVSFYLDGGAGNDTITAGVGGSIAGGAGADTLNGGAGNDVFVFGAGDSTAAAADSINNFVSGSDTVDLRALPRPGRGLAGQLRRVGVDLRQQHQRRRHPATGRQRRDPGLGPDRGQH